MRCSVCLVVEVEVVVVVIVIRNGKELEGFEFVRFESASKQASDQLGVRAPSPVLVCRCAQFPSLSRAISPVSLVLSSHRQQLQSVQQVEGLARPARDEMRGCTSSSSSSSSSS